VKLPVHDVPTKPERARTGMGVALATHGTASPLVTLSFPCTPFTSIRSALVRRTAQTCSLDRPRPLTTATMVTPVGPHEHARSQDASVIKITCYLVLQTHRDVVNRHASLPCPLAARREPSPSPARKPRSTSRPYKKGPPLCKFLTPFSSPLFPDQAS
jgi:hypothetical protein